MKKLAQVLLLFAGFYAVSQENSVITIADGKKLDFLTYKTTNKEVAPRTLVIALHWGWNRSQPVPKMHTQQFFQKFVEPAVKIRDALIIIPRCPYSSWSSDQSDKAIQQLLMYLQQTNEPFKAVILIGYSAGAIGTWHIVQRHPDQFTLAVPVAGRPPENDDGLNQSNVVVIHGSQDNLFPISEVEKFVIGINENGGKIELHAVQGAQHMSIDRFATKLKNVLIPFNREYQ